jgi:2-O-methyltransferase
VEVAVGARDETVTFYMSDGVKDRYPEGWDLSGSIRPPKEHLTMAPHIEFHRTIMVECVRLDTWHAKHGYPEIDFIWADVQGAEVDLIYGGQATLQRTRYFYTEYSDSELYAGQINLQRMCQLLPHFEVECRFKNDVLLRSRTEKQLNDA